MVSGAWMLWQTFVSCSQPARVYLCNGCYGRFCHGCYGRLCLLLQTASHGLSLRWMLWQTLSLADRQPWSVSEMDVMADFVSCRQAVRVYLCDRCYGRLPWMLWQTLPSLADSQPWSVSVMDVMADFAINLMTDFAINLMTDFAMDVMADFYLLQTARVYLCDGRLCHGCYGRLCLLLQTSWQQTDNWPVRWSMTCACLNISRQRALNRGRQLLALLTLIR